MKKKEKKEKIEDVKNSLLEKMEFEEVLYRLSNVPKKELIKLIKEKKKR